MISSNEVDRYLARLIIVPLAATLVIAAMLLLLEKMLRLFNFVVQEGGPVSVVWKMLANLVPEYLSLGIPIGLMLGILLAFRRLAVSSELDVLLATGFSYRRLLRVPYMFAGALAFTNLMIVGFLQPYAHYAYEGLRYELRTGTLGASIKVGEFTKLGKNMTLRVETSRDGGKELFGIFVMAQQDDGRKLAVTASQGRFMATDDPNTIILRLKNGSLIHNADNFPSPRVLSFQSHDLPIDLPKQEAFRLRGGQNGEMTFPELVTSKEVPPADASDPAAAKAAKKEARKRKAELHFRLTEVATIFLLPLLAVALAVPPKRSSSALGVFLSIVMIVAQYKIYEYAEAVAGLGHIPAIVALWTPFLLFSVLVWRMYRTLAHVPGGQPIGAIERSAARIGAWARRKIKAFEHRGMQQA